MNKVDFINELMDRAEAVEATANEDLKVLHAALVAAKPAWLQVFKPKDQLVESWQTWLTAANAERVVDLYKAAELKSPERGRQVATEAVTEIYDIWTAMPLASIGSDFVIAMTPMATIWSLMAFCGLDHPASEAIVMKGIKRTKVGKACLKNDKA